MAFSISSCTKLTFFFFNICFGERKKKRKCDGGSPENKSAHTGPSVYNKNLGSKRGLDWESSKSSSFQQIVSFPTTFTASRCLRGGGGGKFSFLTLIYWRFIFLRLFIFMRQDRKQNKYTKCRHASQQLLRTPTLPPFGPPKIPRAIHQSLSIWRDDIIRRALPKNPFFVVPFSYSFVFESLIRRRFFLLLLFLSPPFPLLVMTSCLFKKKGQRSDWDQPIKSRMDGHLE